MYNTSVATDPYWRILRKNWPHIHRLYEAFAEKQPVMLYDIQQRRVYAYPYEQYRADLSERSQVFLERAVRACDRERLAGRVYQRQQEEEAAIVYRAAFLDGRPRLRLAAYWITPDHYRITSRSLP
jgi:hypothetical protein